MEGKALIYKYLGGVDAIPLPVNAHEPKEIIYLAVHLEPAFGVIHLEDIASPKCFQILDELKERLTIPGAARRSARHRGSHTGRLYNSLLLTGRKLETAKIVLMGAGAANIAAARSMICGADPGNIILVDSKGILYAEREDMDHMMLQNKWK